MATTLIGTLRPHAKGVHVQDNAYSIMDVVTSADGSRAYMAVQDVPAGTALDNAAYWCIYTDMSAVKTEMENAAKRADTSAAAANDAINRMADYTSEYALRVKGEIAESAGNPVTIIPDEGSLIRPVTVFGPKQDSSGWDALSLTQCGKNLLTRDFMDDTALGIAGEGIIISYYAEGRSTMLDIPLAPGTYTVSGPEFMPVYVHDKNRTPDYNITQNVGVQLPYTFTITEPAYFSLHCTTAEKSMVQLEHGAAATPYESPNVRSYNVQFGQTVYGGRMDWTSGVLTSQDPPAAIQFTPHQILALKGTNTLYGDGSSIEVKWVKPLETSIAERVEPLVRRIEALEG